QKEGKCAPLSPPWQRRGGCATFHQRRRGGERSSHSKVEPYGFTHLFRFHAAKQPSVCRPCAFQSDRCLARLGKGRRSDRANGRRRECDVRARTVHGNLQVISS